MYLNWDTFDAASVRGGRFKMPFGFEQNLGRTDLDFVYRSRISTQLTPARDRGVMVYGRGLNRSMSYEVGVFNTDGDIGKLDEPQFDTGEDQASRSDLRRPGDRRGPAPAGRSGCRAPQPARGHRVHERQAAGRPEQPAGRDPLRLRLLRAGVRERPAAAPRGGARLDAGAHLASRRVDSDARGSARPGSRRSRISRTCSAPAGTSAAPGSSPVRTRIRTSACAGRHPWRLRGDRTGRALRGTGVRQRQQGGPGAAEPAGREHPREPGSALDRGRELVSDGAREGGGQRDSRVSSRTSSEPRSRARRRSGPA